MLFWRAFDKEGREHILNVEEIADIVFENPEEEPSKAGVVLANGMMLELAEDPKRRCLVEEVVLRASALERDALKERLRPKKPAGNAALTAAIEKAGSNVSGSLIELKYHLGHRLSSRPPERMGKGFWAGLATGSVVAVLGFVLGRKA